MPIRYGGKETADKFLTTCIPMRNEEKHTVEYIKDLEWLDQYVKKSDLPAGWKIATQRMVRDLKREHFRI